MHICGHSNVIQMIFVTCIHWKQDGRQENLETNWKLAITRLLQEIGSRLLHQTGGFRGRRIFMCKRNLSQTNPCYRGNENLEILTKQCRLLADVWFCSAFGKPDVIAFTSVIQRRFAIRVDSVPSIKLGPARTRPRVVRPSVRLSVHLWRWGIVVI